MTLTKEQLLNQARENVKALKMAVVQNAFKDIRPAIELDLALAELALAGMEAEPVAMRPSMLFDQFVSSITKGQRGLPDALIKDGVVDYEKIGVLWEEYRSAPQPLTTSERAELENYRNAQQVVTGDIDARMKSAGMLSAAEIIAGQPIDAFVKHAGVVDMSSLLQWSEMRRAEFLRMQARYELGDKEKDDLYEWVISHVAVFSELHVNILAAMLQGKADGNSPVFREIGNSSTNNCRENAETSTNCPCCGRKTLKNKSCSVDGCDGKHVANGFCKKHYDIERKKDPSRRESLRAADERYRARKSAAPQQEA